MEPPVETRQVLEELGQLRHGIQALTQEIKKLTATWEKTTLVTEHPYIVCNDRVHQGEPLVRGTAITVRTIVEQIRAGGSIQAVLEAYPILTPAQVYDAMAYYYDHTAEIEQYIAENKEALCRIMERLPA